MVNIFSYVPAIISVGYRDVGILCYFIIQRPITIIVTSEWNFFWILIHLCRSIRLVQIGFELIDVQMCFDALIQCGIEFAQTLMGLFWLFVLCGSISYTLELLVHDDQYKDVFSTIRLAHETLFAIGYRDNAPRERLSRLWTMISVYFISSLTQIILWWFQTRVRIQWKRIMRNN